MAKKSVKSEKSTDTTIEAKLWAAADALRNNMDAAEYKHVVLGQSVSRRTLRGFDFLASISL